MVVVAVVGELYLYKRRQIQRDASTPVLIKKTRVVVRELLRAFSGRVYIGSDLKTALSSLPLPALARARASDRVIRPSEFKSPTRAVMFAALASLRESLPKIGRKRKGKRKKNQTRGEQKKSTFFTRSPTRPNEKESCSPNNERAGTPATRGDRHAFIEAGGEVG